MKKMVFSIVAAFSLLGLGACASNKAIDAAHNSRNSLSWAGVYKGMIPAASGTGINVEIRLTYEGTYSISYQYVDKDPKVYTETGSFQWDASGDTIILDTKDMPPYYQVGENILIQRDMKGKKITGPLANKYILRKVDERARTAN